MRMRINRPAPKARFEWTKRREIKERTVDKYNYTVTVTPGRRNLSVTCGGGSSTHDLVFNYDPDVFFNSKMYPIEQYAAMFLGLAEFLIHRANLDESG